MNEIQNALVGHFSGQWTHPCPCGEAWGKDGFRRGGEFFLPEQSENVPRIHWTFP